MSLAPSWWTSKFTELVVMKIVMSRVPSHGVWKRWEKSNLIFKALKMPQDAPVLKSWGNPSRTKEK
jgi:hypothetical protein